MDKFQSHVVKEVIQGALIHAINRVFLMGLFFFGTLNILGWLNDDGTSAIKIQVDYLTGCEYLGSKEGGITPRLNIHGEHICRKQRR